MTQIGTESASTHDIEAGDICSMAGRLIGLHGAAAPAVAAHFAEEHRIVGDAAREAAWRAVHAVIADILSGSLSADGARVH